MRIDESRFKTHQKINKFETSPLSTAFRAAISMAVSVWKNTGLETAKNQIVPFKREPSREEVYERKRIENAKIYLSQVIKRLENDIGSPLPESQKESILNNPLYQAAIYYDPRGVILPDTEAIFQTLKEVVLRSDSVNYSSISENSFTPKSSTPGETPLAKISGFNILKKIRENSQSDPNANNLLFSRFEELFTKSSDQMKSLELNTEVSPNSEPTDALALKTSSGVLTLELYTSNNGKHTISVTFWNSNKNYKAVFTPSEFNSIITVVK